MTYEPRLIEEDGKDKGRHYVIIDSGTSPMLGQVTPNLENNELMLLMLNAKQCPIDETCIGSETRSFLN